MEKLIWGMIRMLYIEISFLLLVPDPAPIKVSGKLRLTDVDLKNYPPTENK